MSGKSRSNAALRSLVLPSPSPRPERSFAGRVITKRMEMSHVRPATRTLSFDTVSRQPAIMIALLIWCARPLEAQVYDLTTDWSDSKNPNSPWSLNEADNPLPHVDWWQRQLGGWSSPQPAWAKSEDGNNRLPMWYRSNGSETFQSDVIAGDVVVHTTDDGNGVGNGPGNVTWTSPSPGSVSLTGAVWMTRDIGRANDWYLLVNDVILRTGHLASGDSYSRAAPFNLANGTGGPDPLIKLPIATGDVIELIIIRSSAYGDFVGVTLTIALVAGDCDLDGQFDLSDFGLAIGCLAGPNRSVSNECLCADFDADGDVDLADFAKLQNRLQAQ